MDRWKGDGQKNGNIAVKATSTNVKTEKDTPISILFDKICHVAKTFHFSRKPGFKKTGMSPHHTEKIPVKGHIHMNLTLREAQPFVSILSRDLSYIRYYLYFPSLWEKV